MSYIFGNSPRGKETQELVICANRTSPAQITHIDPCPSPSHTHTHTHTQTYLLFIWRKRNIKERMEMMKDE